jgi:ATP-dependent helicase/nuclease subunit A
MFFTVSCLPVRILLTDRGTCRRADFWQTCRLLPMLLPLIVNNHCVNQKYLKQIFRKLHNKITRSMPGLTIYKASAGSGKTHALVRDYLDIIFSDPDKFSHILAVTFTNKATAEMKQRILIELSAISEERESDFRQDLIKKYNLSDKTLKETAGDILGRILQNYSRFYIETIDKFFQRVIRSFAREIQLQPAYNIELNENRILEEAVDRMLSDADQDEFLCKWLADFADLKIREGRHWNLRTDILHFSSEIFKEKFRESSDNLIKYLEDRENINRYVSELYKYKNWFESHLKELGKKALGIIAESGLGTDDFSYKDRGPAGFLEKLSLKIITPPGNTVRKCLDNPGGWHSKLSGRKDEILTAYNSGLNEILGKALGFLDQHYIVYNSLAYTQYYLFTLGILTDIIKKISEYLDERNIFLISDASYFLKQIIGDNETPFIYEKIGNYFTHFMIDEFQDTSRMQWNNFKPLIENSLALNHQNLVVGDVKQSIYRWRNSDWEILSEGINSDFRNESITIKSLTENRRSRANIISFNNELFKSCREILGDKFTGEENQTTGGVNFREKLMNAYADVIQNIPADKAKEGGYVEVSFLEQAEEKTWEEKSDEKVIQTIMMLQDQGYEPRDIAILVRKGDEGKRIADIMLKQKKMEGEESSYRFDLISNELLYLEGSPSVRLILSILKFLVDPDERINKAELLNEYRRYLLPGDTGIDIHELFKTAGKGAAEDFAGFMPDGFNRLSAELPYLSLNEITERIISLFDLHRRPQDLSYLYAFQDVILDYSRIEPPDISSFLTWWDEFGAEKSLSTSEEQNAIRVMTIHKAKGLQFRAVIIPYCNWNMDHKQPEILWCTPDVSPFNRLSLIPVRYSPDLKDTIFREEYFQERFRVHVDHLNLLYVALTRAQDYLFIMVPFEPEINKKLNRISDLLGFALTQGHTDKELSPYFDKKTLIWKLGEAGHWGHAEKKQLSTEFIMETVSNTASINRLRTRWHGTDFLAPGADRGINSGKFIHEVLQSMDSADELDRAIDRVSRDGKLNSTEMGEIRNEILAFLSLEPVKNWFSGEWKVFKERDIITCNGQLKRPDRAMIKGGQITVIDYKTGLTKRKEHEKQIREYLDLVKEMGYQDVTGFLCYVRLKEINQIQA